jgi:hypothetical protein
MAVPQVKQAVHRATAPRAYAKPKIRSRPRVTQAAAPIVCPPPLVIGMPLLNNQPIATLLPEEGPIIQTAALGDVPGRSPIGPGPVGFFPGPGPDFGFVPGSPGVRPPVTPPEIPPTPTPPPPSVVPEPAGWVSMILGFAAVGVALRNRRPAATPASAQG